MWSAEAERHPEALGRPDHHIGPPFSRRGQYGAGEEVGGDAHEPLDCVHGVDQHAPGDAVPERSGRVGPREKTAKSAGRNVRGETIGRGDDEFHAERLGTRPHDVDDLRMASGVEQEPVRFRLRLAVGQRHRFGGGGGLVEEGGVRQIHSGEVGDHRLEVQDRFEAALADLGLVGRIARVPRRILENVA